MNDIISYVLPEYLDYVDIINLALSCRYFYDLLKHVLFKKKKEKQEELLKLFNFYLIDIIGKNRLLYSIYLEYKNKDKIQKGIYYTEYEKKSFLFIRVKVESPLYKDLPEENYSTMIIEQKYSDIYLFFITDPLNYCINKNGLYVDVESVTYLRQFFNSGSFCYSELPYEYPFTPLYQKIHIY